MRKEYRVSARVSLIAFALGAAHVACGVGKDNEERFLREMREDIDRTQSDGYNTGDEFDGQLIGSGDPRPRVSRGVAPPPPGLTSPPETYDAPVRAPEAERNVSASAAQKPAEDEGPIPSFTNANLAAALAAHSAGRADTHAGEAKSSAVKRRTDGGTP